MTAVNQNIQMKNTDSHPTKARLYACPYIWTVLVNNDTNKCKKKDQSTDAFSRIFGHIHLMQGGGTGIALTNRVHQPKQTAGVHHAACRTIRYGGRCVSELVSLAHSGVILLANLQRAVNEIQSVRKDQGFRHHTAIEYNLTDQCAEDN